MAYEHTNSKGVKYFLHKSEVTLRGGKPQTIYFFTKEEKVEKVLLATFLLTVKSTRIHATVS